MNTDKTAVTDPRTVAGERPSILAEHLAGCVGVMLFKLGDISGVYPTQKVAKMIDKELKKFGV